MRRPRLHNRPRFLSSTNNTPSRGRRPDDVPAATQRELAELVALRVSGRPLDELEADDRAGPRAWLAMVEDTVTDILVAG